MADQRPGLASAAGTVRVCCLVFAGLKRELGSPRLEVELPSGSTAADLRRTLLDRFPGAATLLRASRFAVGGDFIPDERVLADGEEVALIPPVSGGSAEGYVFTALTKDVIDPGEWIARVTGPEAGAVVTFLGTVREFTGDKRTRELEYEAFPEMAERKLREIAELARVKYGLHKVAVVHRTGLLEIGEISVVIAVSSAHRAQAFDGCRYIIEAIKRDVPIWKKEVWADGSYEWVHPGVEG